MTCARTPGSWEFALHAAVTTLRKHDIDAECGFSEGYCRKISNPGNKHQLPFAAAMQIDRLLMAEGHTPLFAAIMEEQASHASSYAYDLDEAVIEYHAESGGLAIACRDALKSQCRNAKGKIVGAAHRAMNAARRVRDAAMRRPARV